MKISIGDTFTTRKSQVTGVVREIHEKDNGRAVLLLDTPDGERYTTI